jgi:hypothetical protein
MASSRRSPSSQASQVGSSLRVVLIIGAANLLADGLSMVGNFLSIRAHQSVLEVRNPARRRGIPGDSPIALPVASSGCVYSVWQVAHTSDRWMCVASAGRNPEAEA